MKKLIKTIEYIKWKNLMLVASILVLASCTTDDAEEIQTDLDVINDETLLNARMLKTDEVINISSTGQGRKKADFELKLKGELTPPTIDDLPLQATSVSQKGKFLAISYNYAGAVYAGAIDLVTEELEVTSQLLAYADINELEFYANSLYFVGGSDRLEKPAFAAKIDFDSGKGQFKSGGTVFEEVGSFTANSVTEFGGVIYVTTGDDMSTGGGIYRFNSSMNLDNYEAIEDARWVEGSGSKIYCVSGDPSTISVFDRNNLEIKEKIEHSAKTLPESKQTIDIDDKKIFVAGGEQGVLVYDMDGKLISNLKFDDNSITNAVSAEKGRLFISNGEGGVYVATYDDDDVEIIGKLELGNNESVNHILLHDDYLYVASGLGGVKMIEIDD
ncbi:YncE family protein [Ekhidna sp.]